MAGHDVRSAHHERLLEQCHWEGGPPRNFLRACLLLLLREHAGHGYDLLARLRDFGLDKDPGGVYRTLRALEREGLLYSAWEASSAGPARRGYELTWEGEELLAWASCSSPTTSSRPPPSATASPSWSTATWSPTAPSPPLDHSSTSAAGCILSMLCCMRTTIELDDQLLVAAKQRAAEEGRTLRSLVEEALRARLARRSPEDAPPRLPIYQPARPGVRPGVDLFDNEALLDLMDHG
jgi:poly-beta-hydroxybutyrate-responsive repressor